MNKMVSLAKKMAFLTRWYAMNKMIFVAAVGALVLTEAILTQHAQASSVSCICIVNCVSVGEDCGGGGG